MRSEWTWYGFPGHFICARWCRFHLCTKVGKYVVSTVGFYVHPRHAGGSEKAEAAYLAENPNGEEIGYGRHYETMVFEAGPACEVPQCRCGQPTLANATELDLAGYNTPGEANTGHLAMCEKWDRSEAEEDHNA